MTTRRDRKPEALQKGVPRSRCGSGQPGWRGWGRPGQAAPRSALGRWEGDDWVQAGGGGSWRRREERVDHPAHPEPLRGRVRPHHRGEPGAAAGAALRPGCVPAGSCAGRSLGRVRVTAGGDFRDSGEFGAFHCVCCAGIEKFCVIPPQMWRGGGKEQRLVSIACNLLLFPAGFVQKAGCHRWRDVLVGHSGHCGTGRIQCYAWSVHENWGRIPLCVCH